ncbi:carbohydrate kinase family protein [Alicyclobacillus sacchari]|uniref:carbohydrate kinase family protein n=1 Tax=Alicyclobacillus sacchari TaxID=392010 RepID=UPI0024E18836|nr:carbohydrate kinase [Alicyclobacillus sacchari]
MGFEDMMGDHYLYDVVALGELIVDFTPVEGISHAFQQNAGGAPANVLAAVAGFHKRTCLISMVGADEFGDFLYREIENRGVGTLGIGRTERFNTTLAFVHLDEQGERSFTFYRKSGADLMLNASEIDYHIIKNARIFHFGSISMTDEARSATRQAIQTAREHGSIVTFDPNVRPRLWTSIREAKQVIADVLNMVDVLKLSAEELMFITERDDMNVGLQDLMSRYPCSIILLTLGSNGCICCSREGSQWVPGYSVRTVDTTGAGDGFVGAFLGALLDLDKRPENVTMDELVQLARVANACGALVTTKHGGIPSMPSREQVEDFMENYGE